MLIILIIIQYFFQAVVDVMDKFLISARKIYPLNYTFYTVVSGAVLALVWPWVYAPLSAKFIVLNLLSGAYFSLAMYVFFRVLAKGEVSRVVPFIFCLVPLFDVLISFVTGRNVLQPHQLVAIFLLVPGALLLSHQHVADWGKHLRLKVFSAFLFSSYYAFWQFSAQKGPVLNSLIWNRLGAAGILILLLVIPEFKQTVFSTSGVKEKSHTSMLFIAKQLIGGANFIFLSYLLAVGNVPVINSLQGFRYAFLLVFAAILSLQHKKILNESADASTIRQKTAAVLLIFAGTIVLFL